MQRIGRMAAETIKTIGAFKYAAAPDHSYIIFTLVFTDKEILAIGNDWLSKIIPTKANEKATVGAATVVGGIIGTAAGASAGYGLYMWSKDVNGWNDCKRQNANNHLVDYGYKLPDNIANMSKLQMFAHEIAVIPYEKIKRITISEHQSKVPFQKNSDFTKDYRVFISAGFSTSAFFLIPDYALNDFKELLSKTPLASKLVKS